MNTNGPKDSRQTDMVPSTQKRKLVGTSRCDVPAPYRRGIGVSQPIESAPSVPPAERGWGPRGARSLPRFGAGQPRFSGLTARPARHKPFSFRVHSRNSRIPFRPAGLILVLLSLGVPAIFPARTEAALAPPDPFPTPKPLKPAQETKLKVALGEFFTASAEKQGQWKFSRSLEHLLNENEPAVRRAAWEAYSASQIHSALARDYNAKEVHFNKHRS